MHDADPLALVADAWVRRFDEQGPAGELEVAIGETVGRWRARTIELPDYYLLLDPASWTPTRRHWYLGLLHRAAPNRVVPVPADATAGRVGASIASLAIGRWWPDLDRLWPTSTGSSPTGSDRRRSVRSEGRNPAHGTLLSGAGDARTGASAVGVGAGDGGAGGVSLAEAT